MIFLRFAAASGLALFASCAGPGEALAPRLRAAAERARAGEQAYGSGRPAEAASALAEAVRLRLASGDLPGAARALVNLALAQRAASDTSGAMATATRLRELTPAARQQVTERSGKNDAAAHELFAATAWLDALLALDRGETSAASRALVGVNLSLPPSSPWPGRVATLRAEVALAEGRAADAVTLARSALPACAAAHDRSEEARAQRLLGTAQLRLDRWPEARTSFLAAIILEETLGAGERLARDLEQLAAISEKLGDTSAASLYAARARAIVSAR